VLGANDGIVSTASLIVGVASAEANRHAVALAGLAGLVAGALSMAAGEYVSVSSQADTERAELELERRGLEAKPDDERRELASIYVRRGVEPDLAETVAAQLMAHDALGAHARDELGLTPHSAARPLQAATASATTFAAGAALPLLTALFVPMGLLVPAVAGTSLVCLATLGVVAARIGGAPAWIAAARVTFWGVIAMVATAVVGYLFKTTV